MRVLATLAVALAAVISPKGFACSCDGIQSIEGAIANSEVVIVGRVLGREADNYVLAGIMAEPLEVEVIDTLKGEVSRHVRITTMIMCYRSFDLDDFIVGESYVFPMETFKRANRGGWFTSIGKSSGRNLEKVTDGLYLLPSCSHSALAVRGENLYTNELTSSGGRRLNYLMPVSGLKRQLSVSVLGVWHAVLLGAFATALLVAAFLVRKRASQRHDV